MYVRPTLEYGAVVWAPHIRCDIERVEAVQGGLQDLLFLITIVLVVSL